MRGSDITRRATLLGAQAAMLAPLLTGKARADDAVLRIGQAAPPTSMDPHFAANSQNHSNAQHVFDALVELDNDDRIVPGLATEWHRQDDTTWRFTLRRGVTFHDGSGFSADDVVFSIGRARFVPGGINNLSVFLKSIETVTAIDPGTVEIRTKGPAPALLVDLYNLRIVSKRLAEGSVPADFNSGRATIGTGPYRFVSYTPDDSIVYARNPDYWGSAPTWDRVIMRIVPNGASRMAALLSGSVDLVADVPPTDVPGLRSNARFRTWSAASPRLFYIRLDGGEEVLRSGTLRSKDGAPLDRNPLADGRVRRALSLATNREGIATRIYNSQATPTAQFVRPNGFGYLAGTNENPFDPAQARALLAQAGYPAGFRLSLFGNSNRFASDVQAVQAIAQGWTRIGVDTTVEVIPQSVMSSRRFRNDMPAYHYSWGTTTGAAEQVLGPLIHGRDLPNGLGASNPSTVRDEELDNMIKTALVTLDDAKRLELVVAATRRSLATGDFVPLYFQSNVWAARNGLDFTPRSDGTARAMNTRQA